MANLSLEPVQEVIHSRLLLHGGQRGAPRLNAQQQREGAAMNRAAMVSLAAALEAYIQETFIECIPLRYEDYSADDIARVSKQLSVPHTTNPSKIRNSFLVLGIPDIFVDLRWQKCPPNVVVEKLDRICQIRNRCAHGNEITYNGVPISLTMPMVRGFTNYAQAFGQRFCDYARAKFQQ